MKQRATHLHEAKKAIVRYDRHVNYEVTREESLNVLYLSSFNMKAKSHTHHSPKSNVSTIETIETLE